MNNHFYLFFAIILILSSCNNLFVQKSVFVPMLREKKELKVETTFGREGCGINTAYAFTDKYSLMLNGFSVFNNSTQYDRKYNLQAEVALGYNKSFNDSSCFEIYFGGSRGWLNSNYNRAADEIGINMDRGYFGPSNSGITFPVVKGNIKGYSLNGSGTYYTFFIQPSLGIGRTSNRLNSISWTIRAQYVKFDNYSERVAGVGQAISYEVFAPSKIFIQPMFTNKIGFTNRLLFTMQMGMNVDVSNNIADLFQWNAVVYYIGLEYTFYTNTTKTHKHYKSILGNKGVFKKKKQKGFLEKGFYK